MYISLSSYTHTHTALKDGGVVGSSHHVRVQHYCKRVHIRIRIHVWYLHIYVYVTELIPEVGVVVGYSHHVCVQHVIYCIML